MNEYSEIYDILKQATKEKMRKKSEKYREDLLKEEDDTLSMIQVFLERISNNEIYICNCDSHNEPILTSSRLATIEDVYNDVKRDDDFKVKLFDLFEIQMVKAYEINHHKYFTSNKIQKLLHNEISYLAGLKEHCTSSYSVLANKTKAKIKDIKKLIKSYDDEIEELNRILQGVIMNETKLQKH